MHRPVSSLVAVVLASLSLCAAVAEEPPMQPDPALEAVADEPESTEPPDKLTPKHVKDTLDTVKDEITACGGDHDFHGVVKVRFMVQPDGSVTELALNGKGADYEDPTSQCVLTIVETLRFPAFTGDAVSIQYPFRFR